MKIIIKVAAAALFLFFMSSGLMAQEIEVRIKGMDDGIKTSRQQDYKEAVLFAKRQAIKRAGVKVKSRSTARDLVLEEDYIEAQSEGLLLPGYEIMDLGYSADHVYQVVLVGRLRVKSQGSDKGKSSPRPPIVMEGLAAYYSFDDGSASDRSGAGRHGSIKGNPRTVKGAVGNALYFDGDDDFISLPAIDRVFDNDFAVSVWVRFDRENMFERVFDFSNGAYADNILLSRSRKSDDLFFEAWPGKGGLASLLWRTQKVMVKNCLRPGKMVHYVINCNKKNDLLQVEVYVDGMMRKTMDDLGRANNYTNAPRKVSRSINYIAKSPFNADEMFCGVVDELRIYNRYLSSGEIRSLFKQGGLGR